MRQVLQIDYGLTKSLFKDCMTVKPGFQHYVSVHPYPFP